MNFIVNRKLAVKYGVREAMVLNRIRAELLAREVMNYPKRAGKHWCRMSYKVLAAKLPVLTEYSAGRILRKLVALGLLQRGIHTKRWIPKKRDSTEITKYLLREPSIFRLKRRTFRHR